MYGKNDLLKHAQMTDFPTFRAITASPTLIVALDDNQLWGDIVKLTMVGCLLRKWFEFEINGG